MTGKCDSEMLAGVRVGKRFGWVGSVDGYRLAGS